MPTKLKKPITVEFRYVENALATLLWRGQIITMTDPRQIRINNASDSAHLSRWHEDLEKGLAENGIDYRTWEPLQPIYIAGCEADFKSNGDVKLGSETLDRATLLEVLKRSDQAMQKVEPEWPKFWHNIPARSVYRADSEHCYGFCSTLSGWEECGKGYTMVEFAARRAEIYKPIPRAEACAILGREV